MIKWYIELVLERNKVKEIYHIHFVLLTQHTYYKMGLDIIFKGKIKSNKERPGENMSRKNHLRHSQRKRPTGKLVKVRRFIEQFLVVFFMAHNLFISTETVGLSGCSGKYFKPFSGEWISKHYIDRLHWTQSAIYLFMARENINSRREIWAHIPFQKSK